MSDYPAMSARTDQTEPVPQRVRAVLGGRVVLDTSRAVYVWEWPYYPQFPLSRLPVRDSSELSS